MKKTSKGTQLKLNKADNKLFSEIRALKEVLDELELFKKELKYV